MTRFVDKDGFTLEIEMVDSRTGCAWEYDFFDVGALEHDDEHDAYLVDDVSYLSDRACDYMAGTGDFCGYTSGREQASCVFTITATVVIRIKEHRKASGLTQQQLAEAIGATQKQVSAWELGQNEPSLRVLKAIAKVLGCTVEELI